MVLTDQGKGENGSGHTRLPKDDGGVGEAGAYWVGCAPGRGTRFWVRGTWHEWVGGRDERNLQGKREDLSLSGVTASSYGGGGWVFI